MGEDSDVRRWSDKAWDVALKIIGVLLCVVSGWFYTRLAATEAKLQSLEIRAAVTDSEKATILSRLAEIQVDVKAIKNKVGVP